MFEFNEGALSFTKDSLEGVVISGPCSGCLTLEVDGLGAVAIHYSVILDVIAEEYRATLFLIFHTDRGLHVIDSFLSPRESKEQAEIDLANTCARIFNREVESWRNDD